MFIQFLQCFYFTFPLYELILWKLFLTIQINGFLRFLGWPAEEKIWKNQGRVVSKVTSIKKASDLQCPSKKRYSHFIKILQAKMHFDYLNGGYPLNRSLLNINIYMLTPDDYWISIFTCLTRRQRFFRISFGNSSDK